MHARGCPGSRVSTGRGGGGLPEPRHPRPNPHPDPHPALARTLTVARTIEAARSRDYHVSWSAGVMVPLYIGMAPTS